MKKLFKHESRGGGRNLSSTHAFTLAEVLVTLGIIGVVSAMTVPTLMQNHQRKTYVVQLHKVYNELQQALLQYQTDKNAINLKEAGLTSKTSVKSFLSEYLKVVQECDGITSPCFASSYKNINGGSVGIAAVWSGYCVTLASGSSFCMDYPTFIDGSWGWVFIDINAKQGPNILGRDAFYLAIFPDGVLDVYGATIDCRTKDECGEGGSLQDLRGSVDTCKSGNSEATRSSCFGQILNNNWEMIY